MSETIQKRWRHYTDTDYVPTCAVTHVAKCQSPLCVKTRTENRVSTRGMYITHNYCLKCRTPYPKSQGYRFCPCCSNLLRIGPRLPSHKKKDVKRY